METLRGFRTRADLWDKLFIYGELGIFGVLRCARVGLWRGLNVGRVV